MLGKDANHRWVFLLILVLMGAFNTSALAQIYRWTDANGKVHFSDKPPPNQTVQPLQLKINTYESVSFDKALFDAGEKVVMYSASWCSYCKIARRYFKDRKIRYTEYDIEKNSRARKQYQKMGGTGVPVILVGKRRMNGFSAAGFERIYRR